jgi:hypothetical protein
MYRWQLILLRRQQFDDNKVIFLLGVDQHCGADTSHTNSETTQATSEHANADMTAVIFDVGTNWAI